MTAAQALQEMSSWIEHPLEFNKKPEHIEILSQTRLFWPTQQVEDCFLVKFRMKDDPTEYIGFTGPITWCFFSIDFSALTHEELYLRYTGWYIAFSTRDFEPPAELVEELAEKERKMMNRWKKHMDNITIEDKLFIGEEYYYVLKGYPKNPVLKTVSDTPKLEIGTHKNQQYYPIDAILPFFRHMGMIWDPFYVEE
jgi:hypothetical protein